MPAAKPKLTLLQLTLLTTINMMGSGIAMLPGKLAEVGTISILSWLITALGSLCLAYAFAKCGMYSKRLGMGGYAEYAFGKAGNYLANYTYGVALICANVAVSVTLVGHLSTLLGFHFTPTQVCGASIAFLWLCTIANFMGASVTGKLSTLAVWCIIAPVLVLVTAGWFWFKPEMYINAWNPHHDSFFAAIGGSISMTLWGFLGLESACANSAAVENPEKNVPIAVLTATIGVAVVYIVSTNIIAGIVPNNQLLHTDASFALAFSRMFNSAAGDIVMVLLVLACVGALLGWQFTIAKVFQFSAKEGFFPVIFNRVNRWGAPVKGMIVLTLAQTGFCLLTISPELFKQFNVLVDLAVVANLIPYILSMAAVGAVMKAAGLSKDKIRFYVIMGFLGSIYSFYALVSTDTPEVYWGAIVTFLGFTLWGTIAKKYINPQTGEA